MFCGVRLTRTQLLRSFMADVYMKGIYWRINYLCGETRSSHDSWWGYFMMPSSSWFIFFSLYDSIVCDVMVWLLCELCAIIPCTRLPIAHFHHIFNVIWPYFHWNQWCSSANIYVVSAHREKTIWSIPLPLITVRAGQHIEGAIGRKSRINDGNDNDMSTLVT